MMGVPSNRDAFGLSCPVASIEGAIGDRFEQMRLLYILRSFDIRDRPADV